MVSKEIKPDYRISLVETECFREQINYMCRFLFDLRGEVKGRNTEVRKLETFEYEADDYVKKDSVLSLERSLSLLLKFIYMKIMLWIL